MKKSLLILSITLLFISCLDMKDENTATKNTLASQVDYLEKVNSKVYYDSDAYKMILFAMKKDQVLKPHSASMDTPLLVLEGQTKITIGEKIHILNKGESIILPKNINHGVYPIRDTKFVLIK
jgi:quercetin dioxygenase-like cupin family protein